MSKIKNLNPTIFKFVNGKELSDNDLKDIDKKVLKRLKKTEIGCYMSHLNILKKIIEEGDKNTSSSLKGEIVFSSDPSTWKRDNPVWVADYRARWVAIPSEQNASDMHTILALWLSKIEQSGWIIQWPEVDATKTEIVEKLSVLPTWQITDKKLSKDILAARLGRANCIKVFTNWMKNSEDI